MASVAVLIGQYVDSQNLHQKYVNEIGDIVMNLAQDLTDAWSYTHSAENEFLTKVLELQKGIASVKSAKLELYDFTGKDGHGSSSAGSGFDVSVDDVYTLAKHCFQASEGYEEVITYAVWTDEADSELEGENGIETVGDTELKDTREALISFLKTTCSRYYEAGCRLNDAARAYYGVETDNETILNALNSDPDLNGTQWLGKGGSVDKHTEKTDRENIEDEL